MNNEAQSRAEEKRQEAEENKSKRAVEAQTQDLPPDVIAKIEALERNEKVIEAKVD